ncbi:MAG: helix-turn-helix transcriptional regulator [Tannerellaceae bacterium]
MRKKSHLSQLDLASMVGVSIRTVGAWERGETIPDAEQLWNCAEALGCTPNDILGWYETHSREPVLENAFERELVGCYRESTTPRKGRILDTARDAAGMSKESSERVSSESARREAM